MKVRTLGQWDRVAHVIGSSAHTIPGGWKQYWLEETRLAWPAYCQMFGCFEDCVLGAHIYVQGRGWQNYIMPCCQDCNNRVDLRHYSRDNPNWNRPKDEAIVVETNSNR